MARRTSTRVVLNRGALSRVRLALADGLGAVASAIIETADPPDASPYGVGLVTRGGTYVAVDGRKVGGNATKPRGMPSRGVVAAAGFGFPGRFQELGTVHHAPQPFLTPAMQQVAPRAPSIMALVVRGRLRVIP